MESTAQSSSKVTVEYHDPSGLFSLLSPEISSRLPLRNLNWHSPPRPLRQIRSLHVEFVPDVATQNGVRPELPRTDSNGPNSFDIVRSGGKLAPKERRHQIPGFRTSPYLKVYLLRCDDKEAYKENDRQKIREWIRSNVTSDGKREDHDAFEWMILHVVIPGTAAANEPRWRESSKDPDELKERKSGPNWPGKSTRTVFDRLRADFNETGKAAQDRVSQVKLGKDQLPADVLPALFSAVPPTLEESAQERENAWSDVIAKFKTLILAPFDRRVRHYEADIAEQEARRSLPGWNFCTFFIHKEGLAKALESIGLVEDALALYDELSLGLETIIRDMAAGRAEGTATSFTPYTVDIQDRISGQPATISNGAHDDMTNTNNDAATLFSKEYRESIVRSNISVFDFICYLYSRQKALVLRLANAKSARVELGASSGKEGGEDLVLTSEICWRTATFVHNGARALRQDLTKGATLGKLNYTPSEVESIVCSWMWAVAGQVLEQTAAPALISIVNRDELGSPSSANGTLRRVDTSMALGANTYPQRTVSLSRPKDVSTEPPRTPSRPRTPNDRPPTSSGLDLNHPNGIPGQAELATYRAELILTRRKMLEQIAKVHGWYAGWESTRSAHRSKLEDIDLDDGPSSSEDDNNRQTPQIMGPSLRVVMHSQKSFEDCFERLTQLAIRHYFAATQSKFVTSLTGDLAILKCQQQNYEESASYFQRLASITEQDSWDPKDLVILSCYCDCLKHLDRKVDHTKVALSLLAKIIARRTRYEALRSRFGNHMADDMVVNASELWSEAIESSEALTEDSVYPLSQYFRSVRLNPQVSHESNSDGFSCVLTLTNVLDEDLVIDEVSTRLVGHDDATLDIWLSSGPGPIKLVSGTNNVSLHSKMVTYGPFLIDKIVLAAKNLRFVEAFRSEPTSSRLDLTGNDPPTLTPTTPSETPPFVFVYPPEHAFDAGVTRSKHIHIDKRRHLEVSLRAGQTSVQSLEVKLKPASAGLRLWLADTTTDGIDRASCSAEKVSELWLGKLDADTTASVRIPYSVEQMNKELAVRLEVRYHTGIDTFVFLQSSTISNELPLDVDVNDLFHLDALFSSFTVRTTTQTPLSLLDARLYDSPVYAVESPPSLPLPLAAYSAQPVRLVYKISRKLLTNNVTLKKDAALALDLCYMPTDEMLLTCLRSVFTEDLKRSAFGHLHRLLLPLLVERFKQFVQTTDLEMAVIIGEVSMPTYDTVGWWELVRTLPERSRDALERWLREWHAHNSVLTTRSSTATQLANSHRVTISVDVPSVDVVFTASLALPPSAPAIQAYPSIFKLGAPIRADLRIKYTKDWSARSIFPNVPSVKIYGQDDADSSFVVDIGTDSDTWLVGGQRRRHITLNEEGSETISMMLVPLRSGRHSLPYIEISPQSTDSDATSPIAEGKLVSCETFYESAGQVVQIVRDVSSSTMYIEETPSGLAAPSSRPGTGSTKEWRFPGGT